MVTTLETRNLLSGHFSCRFQMLSVDSKKRHNFTMKFNRKVWKKKKRMFYTCRQWMHHFMQKSRGFSIKTRYDTVMIVPLFACHVIVFTAFALNKLTYYRYWLFSDDFLKFSHVWVLQRWIVRTNLQTTLKLKSNVFKRHLKDMFLLKKINNV